MFYITITFEFDKGKMIYIYYIYNKCLGITKHDTIIACGKWLGLQYPNQYQALFSAKDHQLELALSHRNHSVYKLTTPSLRR